MVLPLARQARAAVWPTLAWQYRNNPAKASRLALKLLGIADVSYRPNFRALAHAVKNAPVRKGAIIECGVFRGSTLLGIAHNLTIQGITDAELIGCDSFQGFPAPVTQDALEDGSFHERTRQGVFHETSFETLHAHVQALGYAQNIRLLKGFFADTLPQLADKFFSLVHLDCDLYESYLTCLNFLYPRLIPGGFMVFDEYDTSSAVYPGAKKAIDEFLIDKPEQLQRLGERTDARWFIVKI